jgi:hypothetical protein
MEEWIDPHFRDLGSSWRRVVSQYVIKAYSKWNFYSQMLKDMERVWCVSLQNFLYYSYFAVTLLCIVTYMSDCRRVFGLSIGFIDHFNTQLIITLNYSAIANFPTLQSTRAHAKSFPARTVFTNSCLVTAPTMAVRLRPALSPL